MSFWSILRWNRYVKVVYKCRTCENKFFSNFGELYLCNETSNRQNKICFGNIILFLFFVCYNFWFKTKTLWLKWDLIAASGASFALILYGWVEGGGGGRTGDKMIKDLKNLAVTCFGWGQYKMYKSIIIINFISWSKKLKPKMLSCVWSWCSVNKLLILWQFVMSSHTIFGSVGDKAQDTQNFWSFCIRGQQGYSDKG